MTPTFAFDCYRSIDDGWVATGALQGMAGGSFEERPLWYGCQGDTWPELQAGICKLVEVLRPRVDPNPRPKAIEAAALAGEKVQARTTGKTVVKVIVVPGKLVNLVVK